MTAFNPAAFVHLVESRGEHVSIAPMGPEKYGLYNDFGLTGLAIDDEYRDAWCQLNEPANRRALRDHLLSLPGAREEVERLRRIDARNNFQTIGGVPIMGAAA